MAAADETIRYVTLFGHEYRFDRTEAPSPVEGLPNKKIQACWEGLMDPLDWRSRVVVNCLWDNTYEPSALPGVALPHLAAAAAAEIIVRRIQREHWQATEQHTKFRRLLIAAVLPGATLAAFAAGFVMGAM